MLSSFTVKSESYLKLYLFVAVNIDFEDVAYIIADFEHNFNGKSKNGAKKQCSKEFHSQ